MENQKIQKQSFLFSFGIPKVVAGCLLALKFAGLTTMSYMDIFWWWAKVWLVCLIIVVALAILYTFIYMIIHGFKDF